VDDSLEDPLYKLGTAIKKANIASYIEVIGQAKIPIVKMDHIESGISVDMLCNNADGLKTAKLMKRFVREYPPLKPLTIVLKVFLVSTETRSRSNYDHSTEIICMHLMHVIVVSKHYFTTWWLLQLLFCDLMFRCDVARLNGS
jgi:hypothetical protein